MKKGRNLNYGFTFIEILIALVLMSMLGAALLTMQYILSQNQIVAWRSYFSVDQANVSVSALVREIRTARYGENGAYPLETLNNNQISFYSDIDFDGEADKVRYFLNGPVFSKGVIKPTGDPPTYPSNQEVVNVITSNVRNAGRPVFYFYNGDWPNDTVNNPLATPATPANTKTIRVYLRLNTTDDEPVKDFILESFASVRVLKQNL